MDWLNPQATNPLILALLLGLASWRISHMLVYEYGPFGIFQLVRSLFGIRHTATGEIMTFSHRHVLNCAWCTSVWVALVLMLLLQWQANAVSIVILIFAAASVPPLIELWQERQPKVEIHNNLSQPEVDLQVQSPRHATTVGRLSNGGN